jgi:ribulose-bisphosphate carboxylase large chain
MPAEKDLRIRAVYWIETPWPVEKAAASMAGEQSCGTFVRVPGETDELRARHGAEVLRIEHLPATMRPSLPGAASPGTEEKPYHRALVELAWPVENVGLNLPNLMATVAGNLFELKAFSGIKLLEVSLPDVFRSKYTGPKHGVLGTLKYAGMSRGPVIGTIIKPSVGLSPEQTARQVETLIGAGLDFVKDDELMGDPPHSPFRERVDRVMEVIRRFADRHGRQPMYAFNISGEVDDMRERHDYLLSRGGTCIMLSLNWVGLSGAMAIARHSQLPIHGHRNGWGMFDRNPALGMSFQVYHTLFSLAGIDHLHTNGLRNKFCESDGSVIASIRQCLEPRGGGYPLMPVVSSGQWADQALDTYRAVGSTDLMYLCGGGITAHPGGIAAGVRSVRQAWDGALQGKSLEDLAPESEEIRQAIHFYGRIS